MKKQSIVLGLLIATFSFVGVQTAQAQNRLSFAERFQKKMLELSQQNPSSTSSFLSFYKNRTPIKNNSRISLVPQKTTSNQTTSSYTPWYKSRSYNYNNYRTRTTRRTSNTSAVSAKPYANIQKRNFRAPADYSVEAQEVLEIQLVNPKNSRSSNFQSAIVGDSFNFKLSSSNKYLDDLSFMGLQVGDQTYDFDRNGNIGLDVALRVPAGDSESFVVSVVPTEISELPRDAGSFRLEVKNITAYEEGSNKIIDVTERGQRYSNYFSFSPAPTPATGTNINATSTNIEGRNLSAGEEALVLALNLEASYDDMYVDEVTVRSDSGNSVDSFISQIKAVNPSTGEVYGTSYFSGGEATFQLRNKLYIRRGRISQLGFKVTIKSNLPSNITDSSFSLVVGSGDLELISGSTGANIPVGNIDVAGNFEEFTVSQGGVSLNFEPGQLIATGSQNQIMKVKIRNNSNNATAIGRITFQFGLDGVEFAGGSASSDDFSLVSLRGNSEVGTQFSVGPVGSSTVSFDANSELYIGPGSSIDLGLKVAFDNVGQNSGDSIAVVVLGDSGSAPNTLAGQRSAGASFIWSDYSGRPHGLNTNDWLNGGYINSLPTRSFIISR